MKKTNGSIRLCGDFSTGLNDVLETHQYPLPAPEDLFSKLNGGTIFSKIDFSDAYLQLEVHESSRALVTINTHRGLYQYNRLPFGLKCAPAIFQQVMDTMLAGLPFAMAYMDDIIVVSSTAEDHIHHLRSVFSRILDFGFKVRPEKCCFMLSSIRYLGSIVDSQGRRPDPEKIQAIISMPSPSNVSELQSFLGLINYYGHFVSNMHNLRVPLNALLSPNAEWNWSKECQESFLAIKRLLTSDLLLTHYNPRFPIVVAADASEQGIGAVILHRFPSGAEKAVYHASRSLSVSERNYSQIEKEALALVLAVKKFHKMLHGRKFILQTDLKSLLAIIGSKRHSSSHSQPLTTLGYHFTEL